MIASVMRQALVDAGEIPAHSLTQKRVDAREFRQSEQIPADLQAGIDATRAEWMRGAYISL